MKSCMVLLGQVLALIGALAFLAVFLLALLVNPHRGNAPNAHCSTNLHSLYQALRIYKDDHGTYPEALYGFVDAATGREVHGLYPQYLKDRQQFHCPRDPFDTNDARRERGLHPTIGFARFPARLYPIWDSYDGQLEPPDAGGTYAVRYVKQWSAAEAGVQEAWGQLRDPNAGDDTVITWCGYHRDYRWGKLQPEGSLDLVLFLDGHVKPVATRRMFPTTVGGVIPPGHSYRVGRD